MEVSGTGKKVDSGPSHSTIQNAQGVNGSFPLDTFGRKTRKEDNMKTHLGGSFQPVVPGSESVKREMDSSGHSQGGSRTLSRETKTLLRAEDFGSLPGSP
jgi:hypothetical protein